jgi:hypothetical protein
MTDAGGMGGMEEENMNLSEGPYLNAALICERVLEEKDGTLSAIRIVDRSTLTLNRALVGPGVPSQVPEGLAPIVPFAVLVSFRSGDASGTFELQLRLERPDGEIRDVTQPTPLYLAGGDQGTNLVVNVAFNAREAGLYWIRVILAGREITRVPFRIVSEVADLPSQT